MGKGSEVRGSLSKSISRIPALEECQRALVGNEAVEADSDQDLEGPEGPQEHLSPIFWTSRSP